MGSTRLRISVDDLDTVIQSFDSIRIKRSITGLSGVYEELTATTAEAAVLTTVTSSPFPVGGKLLQLKRDGHDPVDIWFTGTSLTPAQVVSQINAAFGLTVAAVDGAKVKLTSTITGTESKWLVVGGNAVSDFGWTVGTKVIGKEPYILLQVGMSIYEFMDDDGAEGYYYKASYINQSNGLMSNDSSPFVGPPGVMLSTNRMSVGTIDLVDGSGIAIPDQEITFYPVHEPLQVDGFQVALSRKPISVTTDSAGHAQVSLVRGLKMRVVFEGTGLIREIVVPDQATFDLLQLIGTSADPYSVKTLDLPSAIRRTI